MITLATILVLSLAVMLACFIVPPVSPTARHLHPYEPTPADYMLAPRRDNV